MVTKQLETETLEQGTSGPDSSALFTQIVDVVIAIETPELHRDSTFTLVCLYCINDFVYKLNYRIKQVLDALSSSLLFQCSSE